MQEQEIVFNLILDKFFTEPQYVERSLFMQAINTRSIWTFELGTQKGMKISIWNIVGFPRRDREYSQNLNKDTCYRPPVASGQCIFGT